MSEKGKGKCKGKCKGKKYDSGKLQWHLLPIKAIEKVVKVLGFGAEKYGEDNWMVVENSRVRYFDAAMRHLTTWYNGERYDKESGYHHLAHAICCIVFLLTLDGGRDEED